ncbi:hypothetical protein [Cetobacterium sp.]|uniref:hypothetical protein n=1 Tax=Cetobacterium sp. TaxID=2071632 RepID=UPI003F2D8DED
MKKILILLTMCVVYSFSFSEIKIKIFEPIRFKDVNTRAFGDLIVGEGTLEISTDKLEDDLNKKLIFKFPETGLMTNKKRWLKIEKYMMEDSDKEFKITQEKKHVKIYAILRRSTLNDKGIEAEKLEGEYVGAVPIIIEQYSKPTKILEENKEEKK